jgi:hypothetical protein
MVQNIIPIGEGRHKTRSYFHFANNLSQNVFQKAELLIRISKFLGLPDPDPSLFVRIRILILPLLSKENKKNPDFYCFETSL